jgi:hypothetical protein
MQHASAYVKTSKRSLDPLEGGQKKSRPTYKNEEEKAKHVVEAVLPNRRQDKKKLNKNSPKG